MKPNKKPKAQKSDLLWNVVSFLISALAVASFIMSIVALARKDKDTKYVIPDTSAITPFYNTTISTKLYGTTSNSANATIMMEVKGNVVTIQFPFYYGNCSSPVPTNIIYTDEFPLEYVQLNASDTSQILYSPQILIQVDSGAGTKVGIAWVDTTRRMYLANDIQATNFNGVCYIYPFTLVYFRYADYPKTVPF
jgi:hypothetical protein